MEEKVKLYFESGLSPINRMAISKGVCRPLKDTQPLAACYSPDAWIPALPWTALDKDATQELITEEYHRSWHHTVGIARLPEEIINLCRSLKLEEAGSQTELLSIVKMNQVLMAQLSKAFRAFLPDFSEEEDATKLHGFFVNKPGLETVSNIGSDDMYHGLHIDYGGDGDIFESAIRANRICINIGKEPRYLLFVDKTVSGIAALITQDTNTGNACNEVVSNNLKDRFFESFPQYPVIRLRIDPYEFYIAPTDNLIHDGCTSGCLCSDVNMVFLGQFSYFNHRSVPV